MKRFPIATLPIHAPTALDPEARHHLVHVLRTPPETEVLLFDGQGNTQPARLTAEGTVTPIGSARCDVQVGNVALLLGVLKHQAMDLAIRVATEAGATAIHPVLCERSVAKGDRSERWAKIALSATQQCGRAVSPKVFPLCPLAQLIPLDIPLFVGHRGAPRAHSTSDSCAVAIGPEGGFSPGEMARFTAQGATTVSFGPHILRASTAAAVAVSRLTWAT